MTLARKIDPSIGPLVKRPEKVEETPLWKLKLLGRFICATSATKERCTGSFHAFASRWLGFPVSYDDVQEACRIEGIRGYGHRGRPRKGPPRSKP